MGQSDDADAAGGRPLLADELDFLTVTGFIQCLLFMHRRQVAVIRLSCREMMGKGRRILLLCDIADIIKASRTFYSELSSKLLF